MVIKTERIILSELIYENLSDIHLLHTLPETDQYNTLGIPENIEATRMLLKDWIDSQFQNPRIKYIFSVKSKENQFMGLLGINLGKPNYRNAEIWYKLFPEFWNKGFATEMVTNILKFCFNELKLHRITAGCATSNIASIRVLEKSGFVKVAHHRKILPIRGEWVDNFEYAILEEDFYRLVS